MFSYVFVELRALLTALHRICYVALLVFEHFFLGDEPVFVLECGLV